MSIAADKGNAGESRAATAGGDRISLVEALLCEMASSPADIERIRAWEQTRALGADWWKPDLNLLQLPHDEYLCALRLEEDRRREEGAWVAEHVLNLVLRSPKWVIDGYRRYDAPGRPGYDATAEPEVFPRALFQRPVTLDLWNGAWVWWDGRSYIGLMARPTAAIADERSVVSAPQQLGPAGTASRSKLSKGPAARTLAAFEAITWVIYHEPKFPRNPTALASRACEAAQERGMAGADRLVPDNTMRDLARAALRAIDAPESN